MLRVIIIFLAYVGLSYIIYDIFALLRHECFNTSRYIYVYALALIYTAIATTSDAKNYINTIIKKLGGG